MGIPAGPYLGASVGPNRVRSVAWRSVRSPDPRGGSDYEALLQTAEFDRSDVGFAGMMIRCRNQKLETIFVVLQPLPPGTQARVTISTEGVNQVYDASPIPTGAGLMVPIDIAQDIQIRWRQTRELAVTIKTSETEIKGAVSLEGLRSPLSRLEAACLSSPPPIEGNGSK